MTQRPREITLRFLAEPSAINLYGNVHGGIVMKWIDEAAYACAAGWSGQYCVTVYVGGIRFYQPIHIGDIVEIACRLIYTGNTSMHVAVDVFARDPRTEDRRQTTHCIIVYVAIDEHGKPISVPAWEPETDEDVQLWNYARKLMDLRRGIEDEMQRFLGNPQD